MRSRLKQSVVIPPSAKSQCTIGYKALTQSIPFHTAVILSMSNNDLACIRQLLEKDPLLIENYQPIIDYLNDASKNYHTLNYAEQIRLHYFSEILQHHLLSQRSKKQNKYIGAAAGLVVPGLVAGTIINRELLLSLVHNSQILGIGGLVFVTLELIILALKTANVKNPLSNTGLHQPSLLSKRLTDGGIQFLRLGLRYGGYGLVLAAGTALAPVAMGLLALGESVHVLHHYLTWKQDSTKTRIHLERNKKEIKILKNQLMHEPKFENKQAMVYQKYQLRNANTLLRNDLARKREMLPINALFSTVLLAAYTAFVFGGPMTLLFSIPMVTYAFLLRQDAVKAINQKYDVALTKQIEKNHESYTRASCKLYKESGKMQPVTKIIFSEKNNIGRQTDQRNERKSLCNDLHRWFAKPNFRKPAVKVETAVLQNQSTDTMAAAPSC